MQYKTLHVVASLAPKDGGPSRTVTHLTDALVQHTDIGVTLLTQSLPNDPTIESQCSQVDRHVLYHHSRLMLKSGWPMRRELARATMQKDIALVHSHGLWLPVNHWTSRAARKMRAPLIIQPRGMLEPWAINHKAFKKRLAMLLFQQRDIDTAKAIIATSLPEYQNLRSLGLKQPIAIIPNGVVIDTDTTRPNNTCLKNKQDERSVLFLSRIHPKKGLFNLLEAWAQISPKGWRLKIAGPDEGGHLQEVMAKARQLNIVSSLDYLGEVNGELKSATYQSADLFVLPTFSENFGIVVTEALSHGLPVITTKGTPWADLKTFDCGWWIDIGVEPLMVALRDAMALKDEDRREMGSRGKKYVTRYGWDKIARKTAEVYLWLLRQGPIPDCVIVD